MEQIQLKAEVRQEVGKKFTKNVRNQGNVPAIVYRGGKKTIHVAISEREFIHALHTKAGENVLINLNIVDATRAKESKKDKERVVIIKEVQSHPIKGQILHVDFQEISLTEKITVNVPLETRGEAEGVVKEEGVLEHILWELKVECLPTDIPEKIVVDVTNMKIGDSILVKDITPPQGVKFLDDMEHAVISVVPPHEEKVEEAAEEVTEPELIREKKEEEGEEEAAEGEKAETKPQADSKKQEGKKEDKK
ncbi:MAG: 50S ribosomal protein L25 [Candidatus Omnitrophica bacterium]|nr:50S ribosomal protein L25 [Candidatus Omnitrophota bacterium]